MKLLILSMNFSPELTGIGKYSGEMADGLAERGHEVVVVCAPPYYPAWKVGDGHAADRYTCERPRPGVTVYRCPLWVPQRPSAASRPVGSLSSTGSEVSMVMDVSRCRFNRSEELGWWVQSGFD